MAGKRREVDRSKLVKIRFAFDDGEFADVLLAGDGTLQGTMTNVDALDRKVLERLIGERSVVNISLTDEAPPEKKRK